jgi:hypothetical protein
MPDQVSIRWLVVCRYLNSRGWGGFCRLHGPPPKSVFVGVFSAAVSLGPFPHLGDTWTSFNVTEQNLKEKVDVL